MKKEGKKDLFFTICGVLLLIFATVSISYAMFSFGQQGQTLNKISTGMISFVYNETSNGITITNAIPMTDAAGKVLVATDLSNNVTQGYFDFTVSGSVVGSRTVTYEVYGTVDSESTMDSNYIKVYLTDGSSNETPLSGYDGASVPVYGSLPAATNNVSGKRLYTSTFTEGNSSQKFRLRLWVAETYTTADVSKTFTMRVNVAAVD